MTPYTPGVSTLTRQGEIWMLMLTGEHDLTTIDKLDQDMEHVAASGTSVVVDLSEATFIDSQVLTWLVRWWQRSLQSSHLHLAIVTGQGRSPVTRLLELVNLADTFPCYPTTAAALDHLPPTTAETSQAHRTAE
jgi:anti-anti-sigma factor